jgi:hypothetical protein
MRGGAMREVVVSAALLLAVAVARPADAQPPQPANAQPARVDNLYVTGQTVIADETTSRGAGAEWLHAVGDAAALDLGGFMGTSAGGWFSYGRLGTIVNRPGVMFAGALDLGGGRESSAGFSYTRLRGELGVPLRSTRVIGQSEVDHIRVAGSVVTGLRFGTAVQLTPRLSTRISAHAYASGGDVSPAGSVRGDYGTERWRVMAGMFFSQRPSLTSTAVDLTPSLHATRTNFVGVQLRAGAQDVVAVLDVSEQPRGQVATLLLSLRVPLQ